MCSDDNDTKCSKLLRASLRGTSGNKSEITLEVVGRPAKVSRNFRDSPEMEHDVQVSRKFLQNLTEFREFD